jgi:membrane protein YdbS with pleckstrin-like domain
MRIGPLLAFGTVVMLAVAAGVALAPYMGAIFAWFGVVLLAIVALGVLGGILTAFERGWKWLQWRYPPEPRRPPADPPG